MNQRLRPSALQRGDHQGQDHHHHQQLEQGEAGVENYKDLLCAGGSNYPYLLLADAGVDMAKPEPYRAQVAQMNAIMDEMERLLDELD